MSNPPRAESIFRAVSILATFVMLTGCAAISAVSDATTPLDVYELRSPNDIQTSSRRPLARDVIVEMPTTSGSLSTDRILIRPNRLQAQYLPDVRWSEPTPVMVQTLMLRTIEATGAVRYVGRQPLGVSGDYALVTEVVDFQAELAEENESALVRLNLIVRLVREQDARIIASRSFSATAPASSTQTQPLIESFNAAADQVFSDFAIWVQNALAGR